MTGAIRPGPRGRPRRGRGRPDRGPRRSRCDGSATSSRPAGRSSATGGRWSEAARPIGRRPAEGRDDRVRAGQVEVLGVEPEDARLGVVVADHDDRVAAGEPPDELDGARLVGDRVDGHDRHRDRPAVGLGRARVGRSGPGSRPARRRGGRRPPPSAPSRPPRRGRHSARARRAARRSPPCPSSSSGRCRGSAGAAMTPFSTRARRAQVAASTSMSCCWRPTEMRRSARPARKPDACGPADRLAAAERDEVRAGGDEAAQVGARRQVHRRVDEDRQAVRVGGRDERPRSAGRAPRPGRGRTHRPSPAPIAAAISSAVAAVRVAELDQPRARRADEVVVRVAMAGLDDDLRRSAGRCRAGAP